MQHILTLSRTLISPRGFGAVTLGLLVAAVLRFWSLPGIPPGPHYDEAANGILAAEIANGVKTPIFISSYTGKEVLFFYGAGAVMRLLGVGPLALRLTSALFGLFSVAATAWLVYELFADDEPTAAPWLSALTTALIATSFWHVLLSRVGFRAVTQPLLQALTLAALWRGLGRANGNGPAGSTRGGSTKSSLVWLVLGGLFFGLTGYTYLASRAFPIPLFFALVALLAFDAQQRRQRLVQYSLFGLAALLVFAPLGLYFVRHTDAFTTRMGQVGPGSDWKAALDGIRAAFKMLFLQGDPYVRFNLPLRPLFGPVVALFFVLGVGVTVWRLLCPRTTGDSPTLARAREILLLVWIPIMLLPTGLAVNEITPSNLRAVGLIPLIFVFPARGLWALLSAVRTRYGSLVTDYVPFLATSLLLLATAFTTARAYFHDYAARADLYEASDGDLADIAAYLNQSDLTDTTVYVGSIHYRHPTLAFLAKAYSQIKWLVGASTVVYPASGEALYLFPRSSRPDTEWLARYLPGAASVQATVAADGAPAFSGYHLTAPPPIPEEVHGNFSGVVRLLDYRVDRAVSGGKVDITVIWQILALPPYAGLTPFYHLVDPWGFLWGQAEPFQYAAEDWTPGEIIVNRVQVPVASGAPPGVYLIKAGLYAQSTDARLALVDDADRFAGTTVPLTLTLARAETLPDPGMFEIRQRLDLELNAGLSLLGANLDTTQIRPGEPVYLTLFWQAHQDRTAIPSGQHTDYSVGLYLQNVGGDDISLYNGAPVHGTYPTSLWVQGEVVVDRYNPRLPLLAADAAPGDYPLALTLTDPDGEGGLDPTILGTLTLIATDRTFDVPAIGHPQQATLGDQVELLGYDIDVTNARPDGAIHLTLIWRALTEMDTSYTVFTHLLGPDGQIAAQQDNVPISGTYPTTLWLPGEIVSDLYTISLPEDMPAGDYPVTVGFYLPENGLRLADPVVLGTVVTVHPR